ELAVFLNAAIEREKSGGDPKETRSIEVVRRGNESARAWLARIDAMGVAPAGDGYRANALDVGVLWRVFEDPEEDAELRAAAARLLSRVATDDVKVRVAPTLSTVRDDTVRKWIEAALDSDLDHASELLEELDSRV